MELHPIQKFNSLSKGKKAAVVAGTLAGAAAIGTTAFALVKGKQIAADKFVGPLQEGEKANVKTMAALKEGFKYVADTFKALPSKISAHFKKGGAAEGANK